MSKPWPTLTSDEEAERFVAEADLSEYDFSVGHWVKFVKTKADERDRVSASIRRATHDLAEQRAKAEGIDLELYLGKVLDEALLRKAS